MKILVPYNSHAGHKCSGKLLALTSFIFILIFIFQRAGCSSPPPTEFAVSVDDKTFSKSPVMVELNRENGNLIKIVLKGYVPFSTRAEFKERQWMFANRKFGKQILLALDVNTGYLYKLLPEQMSDLLIIESIEQDKFYLITVQEPDESTWWRNIARLKPIPNTQH